MKLSEISIKRPVFATMMIGALLVLGLFSYYGLPLDLFPDIDFPFATVVTIYPGGSAETVETEVTKKIEDAVNEVSGIRHITSWSRESYSLVIIEFELEKDGAQATQDVREKISGIRADLPDDIEEPVVRQFDPSASPIMSAVISGDRPAREITELTKNVIKKRLEIIDGVGSVRLVGGEEREILVAVDPDRMESYNVSIDEVTGSIMAANLEIPGGRVDESSREYLVRTMGRLS
ncbi:MAG: efflux RND transporter permease subunit, partial [candidate division Zixibacteria bacterium]|nr:efflux RND transporter permease subunit [candidate division Zixibacteria bacterium]